MTSKLAENRSKAQKTGNSDQGIKLGKFPKGEILASAQDSYA